MYGTKITKSCISIAVPAMPNLRWMHFSNEDASLCSYNLLTGCEGRTRKYKPEVFHTALACEGCTKNQRDCIYWYDQNTQLVNNLSYEVF